MVGSVCATHATKIAITVPLEIVIADVMFQMARVALSRQMFQEILHADRPVAGTGRASMRSAVIRCDKRRQQRCASDAGKLRVLAPRRSQLIGSTLLRTRCAIYVARDGRRGDPWPTTTPNPGNVGLRPSYRHVSLPAPRAAKS